MPVLWGDFESGGRPDEGDAGEVEGHVSQRDGDGVWFIVHECGQGGCHRGDDVGWKNLT